MNKKKINKPIIIVGCPRSGTTLLYTILSESPELYSLYNESRFIFRKYYQEKLKIGVSYASDELRSSELNDDEVEMLRDEFYNYSFNSKFLGKSIHKLWRRNILLKPIEAALVGLNSAFKPETHRLVEKTPRNCFKLELMERLFPDAFYVFITRDPRTNISSLIDAWSRRKGGHPEKRLPALRYPLNITGYNGDAWRFALPPGWEEYRDSSLEDVCAYQWKKSNEEAIKGLEKVPELRRISVTYEDLVENTEAVIRKICDFTELDFSKQMQKLAAKPPQVNYIEEKPHAEKWKKNEELINKVLPRVSQVAEQLGYSAVAG